MFSLTVQGEHDLPHCHTAWVTLGTRSSQRDHDPGSGHSRVCQFHTPGGVNGRRVSAG